MIIENYMEWRETGVTQPLMGQKKRKTFLIKIPFLYSLSLWLYAFQLHSFRLSSDAQQNHVFLYFKFT